MVERKYTRYAVQLPVSFTGDQLSDGGTILIQVDLAAVRWSSAARFGVEFIKIRPEEGERLKKFVKALESTI
jgi:hypothetical protein